MEGMTAETTPYILLFGSIIMNYRSQSYEMQGEVKEETKKGNPFQMKANRRDYTKMANQCKDVGE